MLDILIGISLGMVVCAFGMWAFIHGQQNAMQVLNKQFPTQIVTPVQTISEGIDGIKQLVDEKKTEKQAATYQEQIASIAKFDGGLMPTDRE